MAPDPHPRENPQRPHVPFDGAVVILFALAGGLCTGAIGHWLAPKVDTIHVVGYGLLNGHSELSEKFFFGCFVLGAMLLTKLTVQFCRIDRGFIPSAIPPLITLAVVAGAIAVWWPFTAMFVVAPMALAWLVGAIVGPMHKGVPRVLLPALVVASILVCVRRFSDTAPLLLRDTTLVVSMAAMTTLFGYLVVRLRWMNALHPLVAAFRRFVSDHPVTSIAALSGSMFVVLDRQQWPAAAAFVFATALGSHSTRRADLARALWGPDWLILVVLCAAAPLLGGSFPPYLLDGIAGWILSVIVGFLLSDFASSRTNWLHRRIENLLRQPKLRATILAAPFALYAIVNWWTGLLLGIGVAMTQLWPPTPKARTGFLAAILLVVVFLPVIDLDRPVDEFHDGQVLSSVFEFENGAQLFAEVFPLRSYHFALALAGRQFLPPSVQAFQVTEQLVTFLHLGGAFALAFVWTRSVPWALATALLFLAAGSHHNDTLELASRQGMHLWVAALALEFIRSDRWPRWLWFMAAAAIAGLTGFDSLIALTAAVFAVPAVISVLDGVKQQRCLPILHGMVVASGAALAVAVVPTVVLTLWQGSESAIAYWQLLASGVRTMDAFFGLPFDFAPAHLFLAGVGLASIGAWASGGVIAWPQMSHRTRRFWLFLLVFFCVVLQRGVGRSAPEQMRCVILPALMVLALGAFELHAAIEQRFGRNPVRNRTALALVSGAVLLWLAPVRLGNPSALIDALTAVEPPRREGSVLIDGVTRFQLDPFVTETVSENEYLWPMDWPIDTILYQRRNPSRHAIAFTMSSPREQARAVERMRRQRLRLVHFEHKDIDGVPAPVRYFVISQFLFRNYQPAPHPHFLEPRDSDWPGFESCPRWLNWSFSLKLLPLQWGRLRASQLQPVRTIKLTTDNGERRYGSVQARIWNFNVDPLDYNYLLLRLSVSNLGQGRTDAILEMAPPGRPWDAPNRISLTLSVDGDEHQYLVPIGCSPAWSLRHRIGGLRLITSSGLDIHRSEAELWFVDDLKIYEN